MIEMSKLLDIANNLQPGNNTETRNTDILVIDGLNILMRAFAVIANVNPSGHNIGGMVGFLKTLGSLRRQFNPERIIVAWDGKGGTINRKNANSKYKAQRAHAAVIHWNLYDNKEEEMEAVHEQSERILDYLDCLPVTYIKMDKLEADDIIAYVSRLADYQHKRVTIVSSDKDFLQLVSDNIQVYNPVKKEIFDYEHAIEFLGVLPENYNIVKALVGDKSDNIQGIKGMGVKTLVKLFPELQTDPTYTLQQFYDSCAENVENKKCATILNDWNRVETNFDIMNLQETVLNDSEKKHVIHEIKREVPNLQIGKFMYLLNQDQIDGFSKDTESWLLGFSKLIVQKNS